MSINANKEYDAFMAYAEQVAMPEDQHERGYVIWLAAKRHAAEAGEPTLEQQHEAAAAQFLASAPVVPVDALWGEDLSDPCPQCAPGGVCKTFMCGRLRSSELMARFGMAAPTSEECTLCNGTGAIAQWKGLDCKCPNCDGSKVEPIAAPAAPSGASVEGATPTLYCYPECSPTFQAFDAQDASRYRWLVENFGVTRVPCFLEQNLRCGYVADGKESIDAAIDAAMSPNKEG